MNDVLVITTAAKGEWAVGDPLIERAWLPIMGPTAMAALRHLDLARIYTPRPAFDIEDLALALGVGRKVLVNALQRLTRGLIHLDQVGLMLVVEIPGLTHMPTVDRLERHAPTYLVTELAPYLKNPIEVGP